MNPGARIIRPNGLANRPLRPAWVLLQIRISIVRKRPLSVVFFFGGGKGIRTLVGFLPNGFQDRLVMTTSISLQLGNKKDYRLFSPFCQGENSFFMLFFKPFSFSLPSIRKSRSFCQAEYSLRENMPEGLPSLNQAFRSHPHIFHLRLRQQFLPKTYRGCQAL